MKALTILQPYAHLIAVGEKPIENRHWPTQYRGPLLIHAGKGRSMLDEGDPADMAFGAVVAIAQLAQCFKLDRLWPPSYEPLQKHEHANGPFCWILENVCRLETPVPARGAQGLWVPDAQLVAAVFKQADATLWPAIGGGARV